MPEEPEPRWLKVAGWLMGAAMIVFLVWFLAVLLFDSGPAPCTQLGGC